MGRSDFSLAGISPVVVDLSSDVRLWVQGFEFDSGVGGGESPVGSVTEDVAIGLPVGDGRVEFLGRCEAALTEALAGQDAQFHLGHIEPTAILGSEDQSQATTQPTGSFGVKGLIQAGVIVCVEVVANQRDSLGILESRRSPSHFT